MMTRSVFGSQGSRSWRRCGGYFSGLFRLIGVGSFLEEPFGLGRMNRANAIARNIPGLLVIKAIVHSPNMNSALSVSSSRVVMIESTSQTHGYERRGEGFSGQKEGEAFAVVTAIGKNF